MSTARAARNAARRQDAVKQAVLSVKTPATIRVDLGASIHKQLKFRVRPNSLPASSSTLPPTIPPKSQLSGNSTTNSLAKVSDALKEKHDELTSQLHLLEKRKEDPGWNGVTGQLPHLDMRSIAKLAKTSLSNLGLQVRYTPKCPLGERLKQLPLDEVPIVIERLALSPVEFGVR